MIRPSLDPADALFVGGCVGAYVQRRLFKARVGRCLTDYQIGGGEFGVLSGSHFSPAPELTPVPEPCPVPEPYSFPRVPLFQNFQTFQKRPTLYLVFAAAGLCLSTMSPVSPEAVRVQALEFPEFPVSPEAVRVRAPEFLGFPVAPEAVRVPAPEFPESPISPEAVQGSH